MIIWLIIGYLLLIIVASAVVYKNISKEKVTDNISNESDIHVYPKEDVKFNEQYTDMFSDPTRYNVLFVEEKPTIHILDPDEADVCTFCGSAHITKKQNGFCWDIECKYCGTKSKVEISRIDTSYHKSEIKNTLNLIKSDKISTLGELEKYVYTPPYLNSIKSVLDNDTPIDDAEFIKYVKELPKLSYKMTGRID